VTDVFKELGTDAYKAYGMYPASSVRPEYSETGEIQPYKMYNNLDDVEISYRPDTTQSLHYETDRTGHERILKDLNNAQYSPAVKMQLANQYLQRLPHDEIMKRGDRDNFFTYLFESFPPTRKLLALDKADLDVAHEMVGKGIGKPAQYLAVAYDNAVQADKGWAERLFGEGGSAMMNMAWQFGAGGGLAKGATKGIQMLRGVDAATDVARATTAGLQAAQKAPTVKAAAGRALAGGSAMTAGPVGWQQMGEAQAERERSTAYLDPNNPNRLVYEEGETGTASVVKSLTDVFIMNVTERLGGEFFKAVGSKGSDMLKVLRRTTPAKKTTATLHKELAKGYLKQNPGKFGNKPDGVMDAFGINGLIGEIGEERAAEILGGATEAMYNEVAFGKSTDQGVRDRFGVTGQLARGDVGGALRGAGEEALLLTSIKSPSIIANMPRQQRQAEAHRALEQQAKERVETRVYEANDKLDRIVEQAENNPELVKKIDGLLEKDPTRSSFEEVELPEEMQDEFGRTLSSAFPRVAERVAVQERLAQQSATDQVTERQAQTQQAELERQQAEEEAQRQAAAEEAASQAQLSADMREAGRVGRAKMEQRQPQQVEVAETPQKPSDPQSDFISTQLESRPKSIEPPPSPAFEGVGPLKPYRTPVVQHEEIEGPQQQPTEQGDYVSQVLDTPVLPLLKTRKDIDKLAEELNVKEKLVGLKKDEAEKIVVNEFYKQQQADTPQPTTETSLAIPPKPGAIPTTPPASTIQPAPFTDTKLTPKQTVADPIVQEMQQLNAIAGGTFAEVQSLIDDGTVENSLGKQPVGKKWTVESAQKESLNRIGDIKSKEPDIDERVTEADKPRYVAEPYQDPVEVAAQQVKDQPSQRVTEQELPKKQPALQAVSKAFKAAPKKQPSAVPEAPADVAAKELSQPAPAPILNVPTKRTPPPVPVQAGKQPPPIPEAARRQPPPVPKAAKGPPPLPGVQPGHKGISAEATGYTQDAVDVTSAVKTGKTLGKYIKRQLFGTPETKQMRSELESAEGKIGLHGRRAEINRRDLVKTIEKKFGVPLNKWASKTEHDKFRNQLFEAYTNPKKMEAFKQQYPEVGEKLQVMRDHQDQVTKAIADALHIEHTSLLSTLDKNLGFYMVRRYEALDNPAHYYRLKNTEEGRKKLDDAYRYTIRQDLETRTEASVDQWFDNLLKGKKKDVDGVNQTAIDSVFATDGNLKQARSNYRKQLRESLKNVPENIRNNMITSRMQEFDSDLKDRLRRYVSHKPLTMDQATDKVDSLISPQNMKDKEIDSFRARKDIDEVIRILYGEVTDVEKGYTESIIRTSHIAAKLQFYEAIAEQQANVDPEKRFVFDSRDQIRQLQRQGHDIDIDEFTNTVEGEMWGKLHGKYVRTDLVDILKSMNDTQADRTTRHSGNLFAKMGSMMLRAAHLAKAFKTVISPVTKARNSLDANFRVGVTLGYLERAGLSNLVEAMRVTKGVSGYKITPAMRGILDPLGSAISAGVKPDAAAEKMIERLFELGLINNSEYQEIVKGLSGKYETDIDDLIYDSLPEHEQIRQLGEKVDTARFNPKLMATLGDLYQESDNKAKVIGFFAERKMLIEAAMHDGVEINAESMKQIEKEAAERVKTLVPTYTRAPKIVKTISKFAPLGDFPTFTAEVIRTNINLQTLAWKDIASGNPAKVKAGIRMLAGQMFVTVGLPVLASVVSQALSGEDDEQLQKKRALMPEWMRNSTLLHLGGGDKPIVVDLSNFIGDLYLTDLVRSTGITGIPEEEGESRFENAYKQALAPFWDQGMVFGRIVEGVSGRDIYDRKIYRPNDSGVDRMLKFIAHATIGIPGTSGIGKGPLVPGIVSQLKRIKESVDGTTLPDGRKRDFITEVMSYASGMRGYELDISKQAFFAVRSTKQRIDELTGNYRYDVRKDKLTVADVESIHDDFTSNYNNMYEQFFRITDAMEASGLAPREVVKVLLESGMSADLAAMVYRKKILAYKPSDKSLVNIYDIYKKQGDDSTEAKNKLRAVLGLKGRK